MNLRSSHIYLRRLERNDAHALLELRLRNRGFLKPWEPSPSHNHFTLLGQQEAIEKSIANWESGTGYGFGIFLVDRNELIGRVNLSNVVRGAWESCTIGYFLDEQHNGRGYMTEAVRMAVTFAFREANLHRVQAAVMPRNAASIRVLAKVGFRFEGFAEYYLKINGVWEHHNIYSITRETWPDGLVS
ncbi:GNAT family N-acetyltransferase [Alicyclobacillus kakegawensis]|uniref:GNAT family N-acetyltransferase n=1 Tax=Alicyclobacillus kakegawensis TaxID=392012 RepID=UPI00082E2C98|nr:GNAT family protein [Alicyclobacillus kakegawensis]